MPKIDFYILPNADPHAWLMQACFLTEKAYLEKHRIYLHAENKAMAHQLDELLWTYQDISFLPHNLCGEGPDTPPPIQIGYETAAAHHRDTLINMSTLFPVFYKQFKWIIEIVSSDTHIQSAARERYRQYRSLGCDIHTHQLPLLTEHELPNGKNIPTSAH